MTPRTKRTQKTAKIFFISLKRIFKISIKLRVFSARLLERSTVGVVVGGGGDNSVMRVGGAIVAGIQQLGVSSTSLPPFTP